MDVDDGGVGGVARKRGPEQDGDGVDKRRKLQTGAPAAPAASGDTDGLINRAMAGTLTPALLAHNAADEAHSKPSGPARTGGAAPCYLVTSSGAVYAARLAQ
jgi:hypothetical protein